MFATAETLAALDANPIFGVLAAGVVTRKVVGLRRAVPAARRPDRRAVRRSRQGRALSRRRRSGARQRNRRQCRRRDRLRRAAPRLCAGRRRRDGRACSERLARADVVLFDGTLFADDEMIATGTGTKTGRRMGHMPLDGADGTLAALAGLRRPAHLDSHQQHQSDPDRRLCRSGARSRRRASKSPRTGWRSCCECSERRGTGSRACATSARGAIIGCTRSTSSCTAARAARARCRPGRSTATIIRR